MIQESGAAQAQEFFTMFGSSGGSQITGSTSNFDMSQFDDVIEIRDISFTGDIYGAELRMTFLETSGTGANETFFDYSAGYEEFAILTRTDAGILDSANIGLGDSAPQTIAYSQDNLAAPSGTPEPPLFLLLIIPAVFFWRKYSGEKALG